MRILFKLRAWPQGPNLLACGLYFHPSSWRWALYFWPLNLKVVRVNLPVAARVYR